LDASLEPPDQGLCVGSDGAGNVRILEVLNDVLRVYDTAGTPLTQSTALNPFLGYPSAIVRSTLTRGPFVTDPSCLYDEQTGHWFLDTLTLEVVPHTSDGLQHDTGVHHLDLAVSNTSDPTGKWTVYRILVQDDGTDGTPNHHCSPGSSTDPLVTNPTACFGDYPHLGADANGIYLTTNEYSFFGPEFHGAQVYAMSKAQLALLAPTITVTQFDTHGLDTFGFGLNGFTLWPSVTPGGQGDAAAGGTEYFLSSNAAAEAHDTGDGTSTQRVGGHTAQLEVGDLQRLEHVIGFRGPRPHQVRPVARQLAQVPDRCRGDEVARNNPCRSRSASHAASPTSVLCPGTCLICAAFTSVTGSPASSKMLNTGTQYTPVDSRHTCSTCSSASHRLNPSRSRVIVPNVRTSCVAVPFAVLLSTHTATVFLCTSSPAHRSYTTCIAAAPFSLVCPLPAAAGRGVGALA
jgi:hypothetical protein